MRETCTSKPLSRKRAVKAAVAGAATIACCLMSALPAWAAESMTVTFVRHGQSEGNASGDNSDLDPPITEQGHQEALAVAQKLKDGGYDGVYASSMIRTQQTAKPIAAALLGKDESNVTVGEAFDNDVVVVPGLREVEPGALADQQESITAIAYLVVGMQWIFGNRYARIPGSIDGNEFDARMDEGLGAIYDGGDRDVVAVSHGAAMMFWVMMNVDNPDPLLIVTHPLDNTSVVVVSGNPEDGWTLQNWNGVEVSADPSLGSRMVVNVRNLVKDTADSGHAIETALATLDPKVITDAVRDGVIKVGTATVRFATDVTNDVIDAVTEGIPTGAKTTTAEISTVDEAAGRAQLAAEEAAPKPTQRLDTGKPDIKSTLTEKPMAVSALTDDDTREPSAPATAGRERIRAAAHQTGDAVNKSLKKTHRAIGKATGAAHSDRATKKHRTSKSAKNDAA